MIVSIEFLFSVKAVHSKYIKDPSSSPLYIIVHGRVYTIDDDLMYEKNKPLLFLYSVGKS